LGSKQFSPQPEAHLLRLPKEIRDIIYSFVYPDLTTDELFEDIHHNINLRLSLPQTCKQLHLEIHDRAFCNGTYLLSSKTKRSPNRKPRSPLVDDLAANITTDRSTLLLKRISLQLTLNQLPQSLDFSLPTSLFHPIEAILQLCVCDCTFQRRTLFWVSKFRSIILGLLNHVPTLTKISVFHCHVVRLSLEEMWDAIQFPDLVTTMFEGEARYGGPWSCQLARACGTTEGLGSTCSDRYVLRETDSSGEIVRSVELGFWDSWSGYALLCVKYRRDRYGIPCLE
jgi:hypothetical protein